MGRIPSIIKESKEIIACHLLLYYSINTLYNCIITVIQFKVKKKSAENKNLVIRITDRELIEKTGGIIQGMSGSPIIQNGKIIGAVTHVFLNDATMIVRKIV